jgi:hypothetical protein
MTNILPTATKMLMSRVLVVLFMYSPKSCRIQSCQITSHLVVVSVVVRTGSYALNLKLPSFFFGFSEYCLVFRIRSFMILAGIGLLQL